MNIVWNVADAHACGIVRADVPCRAINKMPGVRASVQGGQFISDVVGADICVIQRISGPRGNGLVSLARSNGAAVIFDIDDHLLNVPEHCRKEWSYFETPDFKSGVVQIMNDSDLVTVSTEALASEMAKFTNTRIQVIKNCVDLGHADWCLRRPFKKKQGITIAWHGSFVHTGDVPVVKDALVEVMKQRECVNLALHGHFTHELFGDELRQFGNRVTIDGWIDHSILYYGLRMYDIGISPLASHEFNRCKSNVKWLEYAASEIPCVATPMDPYNMCKNGEDIIFAESREDWTNRLIELVDNFDYRRRIGLSARVRAGREFDNKIVSEEWMKAFNRVLGKKD